MSKSYFFFVQIGYCLKLGYHIIIKAHSYIVARRQIIQKLFVGFEQTLLLQSRRRPVRICDRAIARQLARVLVSAKAAQRVVVYVSFAQGRRSRIVTYRYHELLMHIQRLWATRFGATQ